MKEPLVSFNVYGKPVPWSRPRFDGRSKRIFTSKTTLDYQKHVKDGAHIAMWGKAMIDEHIPLSAKIVLLFPFPKAYSMKKKKEIILSREPCIVKGDIDNYAKTIFDACNNLVYADDKQIRYFEIGMHWSWTECGRAFVEIYRFEEEEDVDHYRRLP